VTLRIGIVVGEVSGDNLGFHLIQALRLHFPDLTFEGVLGPKLIKAGGKALYPMDHLAVMGLIEPLMRLPTILKVRRDLIQHFIADPPDLFIGIDSPDFNLNLEKKLKAQGIKTVHYVSPSVWAWRQGRIKTIQKAVDLMLALFPFEAKFYEEHQVPVCFTGHPLADQIPLEIDVFSAKKALHLDPERPVMAVLPGSRNNEIKYLAETFLSTMRFCYERNPRLQFIVPLVLEAHKNRFLTLKETFAPNIPMQILVGNTPAAIAASDVVLVTSGTATLEVMLNKKPMVVAYRMNPITYWIAKRLIKVPYIALPNLLAQELLVPEFIQEKAKPAVLGEALLKYLSKSFDREKCLNRFQEIHCQLKQNASEKAALAIKQIL